MNQVIKGVYEKLLKFAEKQYGQNALLQAWADFMVIEDEDFSLDTPHMQVFLSWFFFDWHPTPVESEIRRVEIDLRPIAQVYLEKLGDQQDHLLVNNLKQCCATPFSFYNILSVCPGNGFTLWDILAEKKVDVTEHSESNNAEVGNILFTKVIKLDNQAVLEGSSSILFPSIENRRILMLRREIYDEFSSFEPDVLKAFDHEMLEIYHVIFNRLYDLAIPKLQNSSGNQFLFQQFKYKIEFPHALLEPADKKDEAINPNQHWQASNELKILPEAPEQITEIFREHYRQWLKHKIPALHGKTPLQAIRTKDGRKMVERLVREFELRNQRTTSPVDPSIYNELSEWLGLKLGD